MGDLRFDAEYQRLRRAPDRAQAIAQLSDEELIAALAGAVSARNEYLVNVLGTEAQNRARQKHDILEAAGEGLGALDRDGRIVHLNPAGERMLGYGPRELIGRSFHDVAHFQDAQGHPMTWAECPLRLVLERGEPFTGHAETFTRRDGSRFPATYTSAPIVRDGVVYGAVIVFRDVSDEVRARQLLEESEQRYRSLFDNSPDAIFSFDLEGRFLSANARLWELSGYDLEGLLGGSFEPLVAPEDLARVREEFLRAAAGEPRRYNAGLLRRDGSVLPVDVTNVPIVVDGRIVGVYGVAKDISRTLEDRRRLEYYADILEAQNEAVPDAITVVDAEGRTLAYNQKFVQMWGFPDELLERRSDAALLEHAAHRVEDPDAFLARVRQAYEERPLLIRDQLRFRDGRVFDRHGACVRGRDGRHLGWVWTFRDITSELRVREEFERRLRESERLYRLLYENVPGMYFTLALDGTVLTVNRFGANYLGFEPHELEGKYVFDLAHADDRAGAERNFEAFLASGARTGDWSFRKVTRDGDIITVHDHVRRITGPDGRETILNVCEDISRHDRWRQTLDRVWGRDGG